MKMCVFDRKKKCIIQRILIEQLNERKIDNSPTFIKDYCSACLTNQSLIRLFNIERLLKQSLQPMLIVDATGTTAIEVEEKKVKQNINKPVGE